MGRCSGSVAYVAYVAKKGKNAALLVGGACSAHPRLLSLKAPTLRENSPRNKDKRRILLQGASQKPRSMTDPP